MIAAYFLFKFLNKICDNCFAFHLKSRFVKCIFQNWTLTYLLGAGTISFRQLIVVVLTIPVDFPGEYDLFIRQGFASSNVLLKRNIRHVGGKDFIQP